MDTEKRRKIEKNAFIFAVLISALSMITWTREIFTGLINISIPGIKIDIATILGLALVYLMYRWLQHRI